MAKQAQHPGGATPDSAESVEPSSSRESRGSGLAELVGFSEQGYPVISLMESEESFETPTVVGLDHDDIGCMVLVTFVGDGIDRPVVTGRLQPPRASQSAAPAVAVLGAEGPLKIEADGEVVTIEAGRELVLRCGKASLRLRQDGFVEVRGIDVVSRASRSNWIKGGSVALN